MKHRKAIWLVAALFTAPTVAWAQQENDPGRNPDQPWTHPARRVQKASDLMGKAVQSPSGEKLGKVENLMVDLDNGRIPYAIVRCEGKDCAVPMHAMTLPDEAKFFTLSTTKDRLKSYGFDKNSYPNFTDRAWAVQVYSNFGERPYWENPNVKVEKDKTGTDVQQHRDGDTSWYRFSTRLQKASDIIGRPVRNAENKKLGKIEDLAVDPDSGRVIYDVLSFGGFLGMGDKYFAIPRHSLQMSADGKQFTLNIDKDRLKKATGFDKKNWPDMADQKWATETNSYYGERPYWESENENTNNPPASTNRTDMGGRPQP